MRKNLSLILFGLLIFTSLVISAGCSTGLSRSNAADLISKDASFPKNVDIMFYDGDPNKELLVQFPFFRAMKSLGYMDSILKLTEKGKTSIAGLTAVQQDYYTNKYSMSLCKREIIKVTGISEGNPVGAFKEATFTWHCKPVNDIGTAMNVDKETQTGTARFQKFDDGWRVQNIKFQDITILGVVLKQ